jgi:ubiquinone/menaquinone biosynthesis C-methylase UbiE
MRNNRRQSHAPTDVSSRVAKGRKIEQLLKLEQLKQPLRVLDIGTGSGGIAHYFGAHDLLCCVVDSVDVVDERKIFDSYRFVQLNGVELPFEDNSFDVVISNHVIEHVGAIESQLRHLRETMRVLRRDGIGYLAVPNRWMLIEPHYKLIFLSWLPSSLRSAYLRLMCKGAFYDCEPLTVGQLERLFHNVGAVYQHLHVESIRAFVNTESTSQFVRFLARQPDFLLTFFRRLTPTLIYKFEHSSQLLASR